MLLDNNEILNNNKFKPGDEVWAFSFKPAKERHNALGAVVMHPTKGQLQPKTIPDTTDAQYIHFFVPYATNSSDLHWPGAKPVENCKFTENETDATKEYDRLVELEQIWHLISDMLLNSMHAKMTRGLNMGIRTTQMTDVEPVNLETFLKETKSGTISEKDLCYLVIQVNSTEPREKFSIPADDVCLNVPLELNHTKQEAIVKYQTGVQSIQFRIKYADFGKVVGYPKATMTSDGYTDDMPVIYLHKTC